MTEGKVYADDAVNDETKWTDNATLAAATEVTIAESVTLAYLSEKTSEPVKIAEATSGNAVVYVLTDNTLVATCEDDIEVNVEDADEESGKDVHIITFKITDETTSVEVTKAE